MKCFHRTTTKIAKKILLNGFKDNPKTETRKLAGIWLSEGEVYTAEEGAKGDAVLAVEMPDEVFHEYDVGVDGEFPASCVPAEIINQYPVYVHDHDSSGISRENLLRNIASLREYGHKEKADYFENTVLPFLDSYDLLDRTK